MPVYYTTSGSGWSEYTTGTSTWPSVTFSGGWEHVWCDERTYEPTIYNFSIRTENDDADMKYDCSGIDKMLEEYTVID